MKPTTLNSTVKSDLPSTGRFRKIPSLHRQRQSCLPCLPTAQVLANFNFSRSFDGLSFLCAHQNHCRSKCFNLLLCHHLQHTIICAMPGLSHQASTWPSAPQIIVIPSVFPTSQYKNTTPWRRPVASITKPSACCPRQAQQEPRFVMHGLRCNSHGRCIPAAYQNLWSLPPQFSAVAVRSRTSSFCYNALPAGGSSFMQQTAPAKTASKSDSWLRSPSSPWDVVFRRTVSAKLKCCDVSRGCRPIKCH